MKVWSRAKLKMKKVLDYKSRIGTNNQKVMLITTFKLC